MNTYQEQELITRIGDILGNIYDFADDAFFNPQSRQVFTTDMLIEGVHFSMDYFTPKDLAEKSFSVNLSDLAAMGATPDYCLVSIGIPNNIGIDKIEAFYSQAKKICAQYNFKIIGGDTVRSEKITINITAIGTVAENTPIIERSAAKAENVLLSTGFHGLSKVGLHTLQQSGNSESIQNYTESVQAHLRPTPQLAALDTLKHISAKSIGGMDSSDGLADAIIKLAEASQVAIELDTGKIPIHPEVLSFHQVNDPETPVIETILYGGEDFQLIITLPQSFITPKILQVFTPIGVVKNCDTNNTSQATIRHIDGTVEELMRDKTFRHF